MKESGISENNPNNLVFSILESLQKNENIIEKFTIKTIQKICKPTKKKIHSLLSKAFKNTDIDLTLFNQLIEQVSSAMPKLKAFFLFEAYFGSFVAGKIDTCESLLNTYPDCAHSLYRSKFSALVYKNSTFGEIKQFYDQLVFEKIDLVSCFPNAIFIAQQQNLALSSQLQTLFLNYMLLHAAKIQRNTVKTKELFNKCFSGYQLPPTLAFRLLAVFSRKGLLRREKVSLLGSQLDGDIGLSPFINHKDFKKVLIKSPNWFITQVPFELLIIIRQDFPKEDTQCYYDFFKDLSNLCRKQSEKFLSEDSQKCRARMLTLAGFLQNYPLEEIQMKTDEWIQIFTCIENTINHLTEFTTCKTKKIQERSLSLIEFFNNLLSQPKTWGFDGKMLLDMILGRLTQEKGFFSQESNKFFKSNDNLLVDDSYIQAISIYLVNFTSISRGNVENNNDFLIKIK